MSGAQSFVGEYVLESCGGESEPQGEHPITIDFSAVGASSEELQMFAKVANTLRGQVSVKDIHQDGTHATSATMKGMIMSSRMMGPPFRMKVEHLLSKGFMEGCTVTVKDQQLSLVCGEDKAVFSRKQKKS